MKRSFEFLDGKSAKFWEATVQGLSFTVRYGRIGANGTRKEKVMASAEKALAEAKKQAAKKQAKGYAPTPPARP